MINIWDYKDTNDIIITDVDGKVFSGSVIDVVDVEEKSDLEEQEDSIVISVGNLEVELLQSQIQNIEVVN